MSLPPVQLPVYSPKTEFSKKTPVVNPPEPAGKQSDRDFRDSLDSANKQVAKASGQDSKTTNDNTNETADSGNQLPAEAIAEEDLAEEGGVTTSTELVEADTDSLILQLGGEILAPADADQAVLLAARFVVESLPRSLQDTNTDIGLTTNKPEVLAKLQAFTGQVATPLQPTRGVADSLTLENFDAAVLKELGETSTRPSTSTTTSTTEAVNAQSTAAEVKSLATTVKPELVVPNRVGSSDWSEAVAGRITLMINQRMSTARIHIHPPELGPIEVKVNLNQEQASVQFTSQSAQVRDALEQSIPRLREMLETAGFSLADSGVSDQGGQSFAESGGHGENEAAAEEESHIRAEVRQSLGLVDDYV